MGSIPQQHWCMFINKAKLYLGQLPEVCLTKCFNRSTLNLLLGQTIIHFILYNTVSQILSMNNICDIREIPHFLHLDMWLAKIVTSCKTEILFLKVWDFGWPWLPFLTHTILPLSFQQESPSLAQYLAMDLCIYFHQSLDESSLMTTDHHQSDHRRWPV